MYFFLETIKVEPFEIPMDESKFHWSIKYKDLMKTDLGHLARNKETYFSIAVCITRYSVERMSVERIKRDLEILEKRCQPYKRTRFSKTAGLRVTISLLIWYFRVTRIHEKVSKDCFII